MIEYTVRVYDDRTEWFLNGALHRENGPAIEWTDGTKHWYKEGERHRLDGPACECSNGNKYWYKEGLLHRLDGPAVEHSDGTKSWYKKGLLHRLNGPAKEYSDGTKSWYIEDKYYTEEDFNNKIKEMNQLSCNNKKTNIFFNKERFLGKTVKSIDDRHVNVVHFEFTDGTKVSIEAVPVTRVGPIYGPSTETWS